MGTTLTNPASLTGNSLNTFTHSGITLAAGTTYWVSVNEGIDDVNDRATVGRTSITDSNNNTTGETGWSFVSGRLYRSIATGVWTESTSTALLMAIKGTAIPTLVSNTDQTLESVGVVHFQAQSFETGATTGGYTVSEVDVHLAIVSGRSTSVNIRENNVDDEPGALVATLANPDTLTPDSLNTFTAPAGTTLAATTTYWISVNEGITSVSNRATFGRVEGNDETGEPGWSIGDGRLWRDAETSGWTSSGHSLMIAIKGTVCDGIWCATLTVRDLGSDDRGCGNGSSGNECTVHLSDYEFTHAMTDYSVGGVRVKSNGQLQMFMGADIATDSESLVLHVGSETFAFEDADTKEARNRKWDSSGLTWTTGDTIQLKLTGGVTLSNDATLSSLNLSNVTLDSTFMSGTLSYMASVANSITSTTVTAETTDSSAKSVIKLDGTVDTDGTVDLAVGNNIITVEVTAEDTTTSLTYTVTVERAAASSLTTLVSNTDQTLSVGSVHFHAQSFETGATTGGYTVSEVDVHLAIVSGRSTSVNIRENDGSDEPGALVATLANPDTLTPDSLNTFTAPAGTTLAATTTYWISVNEGITSVSNRATFGRVEGNDETGEPGWSIGDGRLWRDAETSGWTSSDHSLMMAIKGTACDGIWCATLTVRDLGSNDRGCGNGSSGNECTVHLSDYEFTHAMTDYSVGGVRVKSNGQLQMFMGADIATDSESLVLHVGSETFAFEDADTKEARNRKWDSSGLTWTTGDTIQLKLTGGVTLSNDATLSSLNLSNVTLDSTFMSGTLSYMASVANSITSTTVTAETTDSSAAEPVIKLDGTEDTDGTVDLAEGANIITVEVTAEDTTTTLTYQVTVTRATDTANLVLSRSNMSVGEAGSGTFTVKLATLPSGSVTVTVTSDDTGAATVSPASLTFTTTNWNSTQTVTVSGEDDTDTDNENVTVTASASGGGYAGKTATVNVSP